MTEEDAASKWCPFTRTPNAVKDGSGRVTEFIVANRTSTDKPDGLCIASACMAWRWSLAATLASDPQRRHGFCGLAGNPSLS